MTSNHAPASATPPGKQVAMTGLPGRGGTAPGTHGTGPARRRRHRAAALAMLAVPLAVTALTAIPAAAATGPYANAATIGVGWKPQAVAVDPTTHTAYVANSNDDTVSVIGGPYKPVTIGVGTEPDAVAVDPLTHTAYVVNESNNTVSVIDEATNKVAATIPVGGPIISQDAVSVDPTTDKIYVADGVNSTVSVIDGATNKVTTINVAGNDGNLEAVAVDPTTDKIYVADAWGGMVWVIDGDTNTVTANTSVYSFPGADAVAVDPTTGTVYVANTGNNTVSVINETTCAAPVPNGVPCRETWPTIGVGSDPDGVGVDPSTGTVYVANYDDSTVSVINGATCDATVSSGCGQTPPTIGVGEWPVAVGVDPSTDTAYVVNSGGSANTADGSVSVITYNPPSSYPSGYRQLVAENSNMCVDVPVFEPWNNAPIQQDNCNPSAQGNQEWQWNPVSGGYGELQSQYTGKDLVVANASTASGAKIIQFDQNGTTNGLWKPIALGSGVWQFQNENSGQCLDVTGGSTSAGVQLDQWPCQSHPFVYFNQVFVTR